MTVTFSALVQRVLPQSHKCTWSHVGLLEWQQ